MNKQKGIIIGILALAVTMMVGYALFSETITINGTATAKGDFDLTYTCELLTEHYSYGEGSGISASTGTGTCSIENQTITTTSSISKPGDITTFNITITNNGSIPAVLKTLSSSNNTNLDMTGAGDFFYVDRNNAFVSYFTIIKNNDDAFPNCTENSLESCVNHANITLQPNESINLFVINIWADSDDLFGTSQPKLPENGATWNYNVTLGFEQIQAQ